MAWGDYLRGVTFRGCFGLRCRLGRRFGCGLGLWLGFNPKCNRPDVNDFLIRCQPQGDRLAFFVGPTEVGDDGGLHRGAACQLLLAAAVEVSFDGVFAGHGFLKRAYDEAIKENYKFYSYGDAMLII